MAEILAASARNPGGGEPRRVSGLAALPPSCWRRKLEGACSAKAAVRRLLGAFHFVQGGTKVFCHFIQVPVAWPALGPAAAVIEDPPVGPNHNKALRKGGIGALRLAVCVEKRWEGQAQVLGPLANLSPARLEVGLAGARRTDGRRRVGVRVAGVADGDEKACGLVPELVLEVPKSAQLAAKDVASETAQQQDDRPAAEFIEAHLCARPHVLEAERRRWVAGGEPRSAPAGQVGSGQRCRFDGTKLWSLVRDEVLVQSDCPGCGRNDANRE